ncbi:hypothetical protein K2Z83_04625 [Oscillochloris sp. ZM17-4]|uniref:hypothetical protein n=1 Tax=Oscillochloris sp. ZM17-4 TaxID=2866714 RepID=UPI001C7322D0|nr:hypothetical protein [Oscillochloris sp. ZM17-4]MBX0326966.1 hypothetical protein [Oscillochloris sp. ZM17-4]
MSHDILEISSVPRQRAELKALIGTARAERRTSHLIRFAAANLAAWSLIIPMLHGCNAPSAAVVSSASYTVFLPAVIHGK